MFEFRLILLDSIMKKWNYKHQMKTLIVFVQSSIKAKKNRQASCVYISIVVLMKLWTFYYQFFLPFCQWKSTSHSSAVILVINPGIKSIMQVQVNKKNDKKCMDDNMWHDRGKWVTCRKFQSQFSYITFSLLQNA